MFGTILAVVLDCYFCDGKGEIPEIQLQWREEGNVFRAYRLSKNLTLRQASDLLNIKPSVLASMEQGKIKPEINIKKYF